MHVRRGATPVQGPGSGLRSRRAAHQERGGAGGSAGSAVLSEPRRRGGDLPVGITLGPGDPGVRRHDTRGLERKRLLRGGCRAGVRRRAVRHLGRSGRGSRSKTRLDIADPLFARTTDPRPLSARIETGRDCAPYSAIVDADRRTPTIPVAPAPGFGAPRRGRETRPGGATGSCIGSVARAPSRLGEARTCDHDQAEDWCVGRVTAAWEAPCIS